MVVDASRVTYESGGDLLDDRSVNLSDKKTLAVYADQARDYAEMVQGIPVDGNLERFLAALPAGGHVLDWGCGAGNASAVMRERGHRVTSTDASEAFAIVASESYGIDVREPFPELGEENEFDGIWANFSLLHAPKSEMPNNLALAYRAVKSGGKFCIGLKTGTGERRDSIGRFYAYYEDSEITDLMQQAGFSVTDRRTGSDIGLDGKNWSWIVLFADA